MAKMFYTTEEATSVLKCDIKQIDQFAREGRLREFRDGSRKMFKADQVENLRDELGIKKDEEQKSKLASFLGRFASAPKADNVEKEKQCVEDEFKTTIARLIDKSEFHLALGMLMTAYHELESMDQVPAKRITELNFQFALILNKMGMRKSMVENSLKSLEREIDSAKARLFVLLENIDEM